MKKNITLALLLLNLASFSAFSAGNQDNIIIEESEPAPMTKTLNQINILLKNYNEFFDQNPELLKFLALIIEKTKGTIFEKMDLAKKFIETSKELVPDSNDRDHFVKLTYEILKNTTSSLNDYINLFTFIYKIEPTQFDNIESMIKNMLQQNNVKSTNNIISFIKTFNAASEESRKNILKWEKNILSFIPHEYKDEKSFASCIQSIANDPSLTFSEPLKKFIHLISKKDHNSKANPDVLFKIILHTSEADFNKGMPLVEKLFTTHASWGYSDCVSISSYILERAMSPEFLERFNFIYTKSKNNHWDAKTLADCVEQIYQLNENEFNKIKPQTIAANLDFYLQKKDVLFNAKLFLDSVIFEDFESKDIPRSTLMALWENGTTRHAYSTKLADLLFCISEQSDDDIKSSILNSLWKHKEFSKKYCIKIVDFLFTLPEYQQKNIQFDILKELWKDPETKQLHHEALSNMFIDFLQNIASSEDTNYIYNIIQELMSYPEIQKFTKYQLIYLFLDHIQKNSIIEKNYKIFIELTKNEKIFKKNKLVLIKIFKEYIKKSLNTKELKHKFNTEGNIVSHNFLGNTKFDRFNSFLNKIYIPRIDAYIIFGHPFQETYNEFILHFWSIMNNDLKRTLCEKIINVFGAENPRVQELLFLYARENLNGYNPTFTFANLLKKTKEPYTHNLSIQDATLIKNANEEILHTTINPEIFSYLPISQDALASLDDVDAILGDLNTIENEKLINIIKAVRSNHEFQSYFMAPFSEEAIMLQAMIKKFKEMKEDGKERLINLMHQMHQCKKGKNQAIWDHYSIESKLLFTADLKTITDWLIRLHHTSGENLPAPYKTKNKWIDLINMIINKDHIFRRHLTDFQTEDAQRLKGLLGYLHYLEQDIAPNNHDQLNKHLKNVLKVLVQLSNPDDFYQNLTKLCDAHKIYLPANKFGNHLSINSINQLIQNLKEKDIEGRGDLHKIQTEMDHFVKNQDFIDLLNNFNDENGQKLRELIGGYIINGWSVGLLNLMDLSKTSTLYAAVDEMFKHVNIDKDVSLSWANLKKIIMKELIDLKRQSINALAENITNRSYAKIPHSIAYLESLLGGAIGLRNAEKIPDFDPIPLDLKLTSKSLQEALDLFHEHFTPNTIINHLASMISEKKISIIDPKTGINIISDLIRMAAQEQLNIDQTDDLLDLLYDEDSGTPKPLAFILLLIKLEILKEKGESTNIITNNILTLD